MKLKLILNEFLDKENNPINTKEFSNYIEIKYGVEFWLGTTFDNNLSLHHFVVPKEKRKSGIGSQIMEELIKFADKYNKMLVLSPATRDDRIGTTSKARLVKFYKRFGFVENKGRNKDYRLSYSMYRKSK